MSERLEEFHYQENQAIRLDKYLVACLPQYSRSYIQKMIREGYVIIDGIPAHKPGQMLEYGSIVRVHIPPTQMEILQPEAIPLEVIFENEDLLVVNKPAGMVVHPAAGHQSGTLVHAALAHAPEMAGIGGEHRPGVVHRLDKNTSGLILLAKNDAMHHWLQEQFRARKVQKEYLALVDGKPPTPHGRIEAPIGRQASNRKQMAIVGLQKGRQAITEYRVLESYPHHSLLEVHPITGRTHQIRLHLNFIKCPVVGDTVYGHKRPSIPLERHFLHAYRITVQLYADSQPCTFEAPLPVELIQILERLRNQNILRHDKNKTPIY